MSMFQESRLTEPRAGPSATMVKEENEVRTLRGHSAEVEELAKKLSNRALTTSRGLQLCWSLLAEEICNLKGRLDTEAERRNDLLNEVKKVTSEVGELRAKLALFGANQAADVTLDGQQHCAEPPEDMNSMRSLTEESGKQDEGEVSYVDIADIMEIAPMNLYQDVYRHTSPSAYPGNKITITNNHTGVTITGNHAGGHNGETFSPKLSPEVIDNVPSTVPWLSKKTPSSSRKSSASGLSSSKRREKYLAKVVRKSLPLPDYPKAENKQESVPPKILASTKIPNKDNHDLLDKTLFGAKDPGDGRRWWEGCLFSCHYCSKHFHDVIETGHHVRLAHRLMARDNMMVNNYSVEELKYFNCKLCFLGPKPFKNHRGSTRVGYGLKCQKSSILSHLKERHSLTSISEYESLCTGYALEKDYG